MRLLVVTAVERERAAIGSPPNAIVCAGGVGRTNAAVTTVLEASRHDPFDAVVSAGVAGILPGATLAIGETLLATGCAYYEEGMVTPEGFADVSALGFPLGDFAGNTVPVDHDLLAQLRPLFPVGVIATVATASGTDAAARRVADRTGAQAEAMEGAAVVHAARRLGLPAIEIRTMSNTTGDRSSQSWDLPRALETLGASIRAACDRLA